MQGDDADDDVPTIHARAHHVPRNLAGGDKKQGVAGGVKFPIRFACRRCIFFFPLLLIVFAARPFVSPYLSLFCLTVYHGQISHRDLKHS